MLLSARTRFGIALSMTLGLMASSSCARSRCERCPAVEMNAPAVVPSIPDRSPLAAGMIRKVQVREGVSIREQPRALAKKVVKIPHHAEVTVLEMQDVYVRVSPLASPQSVGWMRGSDLQESPSTARPLLGVSLEHLRSHGIQDGWFCTSDPQNGVSRN